MAKADRTNEWMNEWYSQRQANQLEMSINEEAENVESWN